MCQQIYSKRILNKIDNDAEMSRAVMGSFLISKMTLKAYKNFSTLWRLYLCFIQASSIHSIVFNCLGLSKIKIGVEQVRK